MCIRCQIHLRLNPLKEFQVSTYVLFFRQPLNALLTEITVYKNINGLFAIHPFETLAYSLFQTLKGLRRGIFSYCDHQQNKT